MKKTWENPKLQMLNLNETETIGYTYVTNCGSSGRGNNGRGNNNGRHGNNHSGRGCNHDPRCS